MQSKTKQLHKIMKFKTRADVLRSVVSKLVRVLCSH